MRVFAFATVQAYIENMRLMAKIMEKFIYVMSKNGLMHLTNGQFELCISLYLSNFHREKGTIQYIAESLSYGSGHARTFLMKLTKIGVLLDKDYAQINGKLYKAYILDRGELLKILKENTLFKKMGAIIYEDYEVVFRDLEAWHKFDKDELKEFKKMVK